MDSQDIRRLSTLLAKTLKQAQLLWIRATNSRRPPRDFIVTGIPRSGTSLVCASLTEADDCVCLNEIHYQVDSLPLFFRRIRKKVLAGEPVPNKIDEKGRLITSTDDSNKDSIRKQVYPVKGNNVVVGSKVTIPYLNQIGRILDHGYKVIVMVRDPVYTLGSWNSEKLSDTPMNKVCEDDLHPHWQNVEFISSDKIERQAQIWEYYASLIWSLRDKVKICKYEQLIEQQELVIRELVEFLGISLPRDLEDLKSRNVDSNYDRLESIRNAAKKYCPSRKLFGYP